MVNSIGNTNAVAGLPSYSGRMLRQLASPAFAGATAARPLGSLTGVRPGTPSNTITATSTTWTAQPFAGNADVESLAIAGGYPFAFDAVQTGAVTPASASYPRADIMYVQIDDPSEDGSATPAASLKYAAGTVLVGGVLTAPLPVTRAFIVATINVPISGGGSPSVTWGAPVVVAAGAILPVPTVAALPSVGYPGQYASVTADPNPLNNMLYTWTGAAWKGVTPVTGQFASTSNTTGASVITFPTGHFAAAPVVQATMTNFIANMQVMITPISNVSMTVQTFNVSTGANISGIGFHWSAV
jgi:hypothetical protein